MERQISESDWRLLRTLQPIALERFCRRVLDEVAGLTSGDDGRSNHDRYLALFDLVKKQDKELAVTFDDLRRSTAFFRIAAMRHRKLLTDEEFAQFGEETRDVVELMLRGSGG
jgi:hypothetical protein